MSVTVIDPEQRDRRRDVYTRERGRDRRRAGPRVRNISGLQFVDQVRELRIDDAAQLLSTARRTRKNVRTHLQEPRSTKLWQHIPATIHELGKPLVLRAAPVEPDWQERDRSRVPE